MKILNRMKKKFKLIMTYFKSAKLKDVAFEVEVGEDGYVGSVIIHTELLSVAEVIKDIIQDIINIYAEKCIDEGLSSVDVDGMSSYYRIYGLIDVVNETIIFENLEYHYYDTQESGNYYDKDDYEEGDSMYEEFLEIDKILTELNIDDMIVSYEGGGDNGFISSEYTTENGQSGDVPTEIENICYNILSEYGGWEINEGSQGSFTITKDQINHDHYWNVEESDLGPIEIKVTQDSFSE